MQRLTTAAPIDEATLTIYEETVAIIHRHLPPSLALLYATARRGSQGHLEWWTERQGLAKPFSALSEAEQASVQSKRQQYHDVLAGLIEQLLARGEEHSAHALQRLLTHSRDLNCYSVGGEPVLINWVIISEAPPLPVVVIPWWRRSLPWLLLLLLLLLIACAGWWWHKNSLTSPSPPLHHDVPTAAPAVAPASTNLTQANPSINLEKRKDFGRIKINLTWQQGSHKEPIDLDIAAFIRFKNGKISGAEALSKFLGNYDKPPYLLLQQDLREGNNQEGEWLFINGSHWQDIDEVLIYSFIYGGADNWQGTNATITIYVPDQPPIISTLTDSNQRNNVAAIARLKNVDGNITVERLDRFFPDRKSLDKHYGWGFEWTPGASKK
ncbi:tellurite resistance domain protein [Citrobacter sp. RHBSTW-00696]|uniref:tellurite resistance domain protein n=1 Tax=Citrobacter TaxID=544 RepID=UPI0015E9E452|nr:MULTISPECIES: tellurite resistance domain protein [Citrobacter]MBA8088834.1 tellurite resistance domain protein [Citrobacter sp. RHBSTW-00089]MBS9487246.1 tellurite resistance domain protein [Citrobacter braakii]MDE9660996.1 tellurite resistance domain protein [Citrobacter braakii]MEC3927277.1 tellurite resistance domain protein [Citrobacter braakii]QLR25352.1 tellurite resistance domain protein [Citrobacter sp. RHBSTW-01013]